MEGEAGTKKTARIVGSLFLISYFGVFAGLAISGPILGAPDYLAQTYPNRTQVLAGELIGLLNDAAVIGIGIMLFPILRKHSGALALGYVAFRAVEAVFLVMGRVSLLSIITISREYIAAGSPAASYFQTLGASALAVRFWAGELSGIFFIVTALILYYIAYRSRILPRFISIWGFIGAAAISIVLALAMLEISTFAGQLLALPIISNELFLAVWLIAKGFNPPASAS